LSFTRIRQIIDPQLEFGKEEISRIKLHPRCWDDIPRMLWALQYIYVTQADDLRRIDFESVIFFYPR
jgi:hypothetical protein